MLYSTACLTFLFDSLEITLCLVSAMAQNHYKSSSSVYLRRTLIYSVFPSLALMCNIFHTGFKQGIYLARLSDRFVNLWKAVPPWIPSAFKCFIPKLACVFLQQASWSTSLWLCYFHYAAFYLVSVTGLCLWRLSAGVFGNVCIDNRGERHSSC